MFDTITAIATGMGMGAIGIIRVSGPDSALILEKLTELKRPTIKHNYLNLTYIIDSVSGNRVDQVMVCYMPAPHSYTGEDIVEINCHGGNVIINQVLELVIRNGARLAQPGEFTKRAFLNGKLDMVQAEAVMDMISARTQASARIALGQLSGQVSKKIYKVRLDLLNLLTEIEAMLDFPDDMQGISGNYIGIVNKSLAEINLLLDMAHDGQIYRDGVSVAIVGLPNVGKSSLLNCFLGNERAIVSDIAGTTRDTIEEVCNIEGIAFRFIDTAGIRDISHEIEREGIKRSLQKIDEAQVVLFLIDVTCETNNEEIELLKNLTMQGKNYIIVANKTDLLDEQTLMANFFTNKAGLLNENDIDQLAFISIKQEYGLENLRKMLLNINNITSNNIAESDYTIISNIRHIEKLVNARKSLENVLQTERNAYPLDFWSIDLRDSVVSLGEITGEDISEEIIGNIFNNFCIGK